MLTKIIYHANCPDGITAAWCAKRKWPDAILVEGRYDKEPCYDELRGSQIVMVDFSYKQSVIEDLYALSSCLWVVDHHKTAKEALEAIPPRPGLFINFDLERSGAGLAWDLFVGGQRHPLVNYVEDRDLWLFRYPETKAVHAGCSLEPLTYEARDALMNEPLSDIIERGKVVLRYHEQLVKQAVRNRPRARVAGHDVPCVPCQVPALHSDVGHALCQGEPFSATYQVRDDGLLIFSLRSDESGVDVSAIAKSFGGGGHPHAAGFSVRTLEEAAHG